MVVPWGWCTVMNHLVIVQIATSQSLHIPMEALLQRIIMVSLKVVVRKLEMTGYKVIRNVLTNHGR